MAAKRRAHNATSNYAITRSGTGFGKEGGGYLGKLLANFVGTEFQVGGVCFCLGNVRDGSM